MAYYPIDKQKTILQYNAIDDIWYIETTYPKHIEAIHDCEEFEEILKDDDSYFEVDVDEEGYCNIVFMGVKDFSTIRKLLDL